MTPEDQSRIEQLKKALYSRNAPDIRSKRRLHFHKENFDDIKTDWEHPKEEVEEVNLNTQYEDSTMPFFKKIFIGSIIFFVIALGIGAYLFFNGSNIVSANNIDITISGPVSISGGSELPLNIQVVNKNNIKLETVDLAVDYPPGTIDPTDSSKELKQYRQLMDDIEPGGLSQRTVKAIVYGEENTKKDILVTISYHVSGSSSVFQKQKTFEFIISSSAVTMSIDSYNEVTSGQSFDIKVAINSNSKDILKNMILKASYPFGYTFISSDTKTLTDNATWNVGDLPPGGKKIITIKGKIDGQNDETRVFRFSLGQESNSKPRTIGTEFTSAVQELSIQKPFISLGIALDGNDKSEDYVARFDNAVKTDITWFNNLSSSVSDGEVHVKFSGNAFDKFSVSPEGGLYQSANNEVVWNKVTNSSLESLGAGDSGDLTFSFTPRNLSTASRRIINPVIILDASVFGKRLSENNVPESVVSNIVRKVKISSNVSLLTQTKRKSPPFENTGPVPPQAEKETTYTIVWTVNNTSNTLSAAQVNASLPAYVKWTGKTSPTDEDITYDKDSNTVAWNLGNVDTYTQDGGHSRQVSFQVSVLPNVNQIGNSINILNNSFLTARDDFTGATLTDKTEPATTNFSSDSSYIEGSDKVVR